MLKRLLIVSGFILVLGLVILGLVMFLRSYGGSDAPPSPTDVAPEVSGQLPEITGQIPVDVPEPIAMKPVVSPEELEQAQAAVFAKDFAARLATYSNQNRSSNIEELLPEASGSARDYLESLLDESRFQTEYIGVTSRALVSRWLEWNAEGESMITVGLWRVETRNGEENGYMQDVDLRLVQDQQQWLVVGIQWNEPKQSPL